MKKILFIIMFMLPNICVVGQVDKELNELLKELDRTIQRKSEYISIKETKIEEVKSKLYKEKDIHKKILLYKNIISQYTTYNTDSAFHYVGAMKELSLSIANKEYIDYADIMRAKILGMQGKFIEALALSDKIASSLQLTNEKEFIKLKLSLLNMLRNFSTVSENIFKYERQAQIYRDSLLNNYDLNDNTYLFLKAEKLLINGNYDEVLDLILPKYNLLASSDRAAGLMAYNIASAYQKKGNTLEGMKFFVRSAICDLKNGIREYISLRIITQYLYDIGDIDRSYQYMLCFMKDATESNSHLRTLEISKIFNMIDNAFQKKEQNHRKWVYSLLIVIVTFLFFLLIFFLLIVNRNKKLTTLKSDLSKINKLMQQDIIALTDANNIKEEYLWQYMEQYSHYLSRLNAYIVKIRAVAASKGNKTLLEYLDTTFDTNKDKKEFYHHFDQTILRLFPDFVEQFNSLMLQGCEEIPKKTELLTSKLRIYALIRLGIADSVKIARFLDYSLPTIYSYRTKMRNNARKKEPVLDTQVMSICKK